MTKFTYVVLLLFCVAVFVNSVKDQEFPLMISAVCNFCLLMICLVKGAKEDEPKAK